MGEILDRAKQDIRFILNNGGFNQELTITPTGDDSVSIQGICTRHSMGFDSEGRPIIADNIHCSFSEIDLNELEVVTRNAAGDLNIKDWIVAFTDTIGAANYKISEAYPDGTLGIIKCMLTHYE